MRIKNIKASLSSYSPNRRKYKDVKYIVLHYTGNVGDTATNNGKHFKNSNTRLAGAHFFVGQDGEIVRSVPMTYTAWAVGASQADRSRGGGSLFGKCTNYNSVSIEMCDQVNRDASEAQKAAVKWLINYIRKRCPNATGICRHFDVTGKLCPAQYIEETKWRKLKKEVSE